MDYTPHLIKRIGLFLLVLAAAIMMLTVPIKINRFVLSDGGCNPLKSPPIVNKIVSIV